MGQVSVARALSVRLVFASHGLISIWRLADVTDDVRYWYLACTLCLLIVETIVTLTIKKGKEWKWFCPSVFIYLMTSVPAIWFLELHEYDARLKDDTRSVRVVRTYNQTVSMVTQVPPSDQQIDLSAPIGSFLGLKFEIRIPIKLNADQWIRMLEQILLLVLILGRWLLPRGKLTHDQLSQLLLVYIGTAADIVEFFEGFKEKEVQKHKILCIIILAMWSLSLVQFSLVLTASRRKRDKTREYSMVTGSDEETNNGCCSHADVFGIIISILVQDLPFLVLRMYLIFQYRVLSYTNIFFTSKNTLVIALQIYRLVVLFIERKSRPEMDDKQSESGVHECLISESTVFRRTSTMRKSIARYYSLELDKTDVVGNEKCQLATFVSNGKIPVVNADSEPTENDHALLKYGTNCV